MIKKLIPITKYAIQFTDEELEKLGMKVGDKFTFKLNNDGSVLMVPYTTMEIELDDFPREVLIELIRRSCEEDISVNEVICGLLREYIKEVKKDK